jgi:hypothetical protein
MIDAHIIIITELCIIVAAIAIYMLIRKKEKEDVFESVDFTEQNKKNKKERI